MGARAGAADDQERHVYSLYCKSTREQRRFRGEYSTVHVFWSDRDMYYIVRNSSSLFQAGITIVGSTPPREARGCCPGPDLLIICAVANDVAG